MCGRYASSRRPEDLVEEFEVVDSRGAASRCAPDYNVAPTKEVYAVVERPPSRGRRRAGEPPERQLRVLTLGAGAVLGQGPLDRQPDDQRPDGDGGREAGVPAGLRVAALPAAGRRLLRVVPHRAADQGRQAAQAAVLHPARRTAACWRWPGSTRSGATPTRPTTTPTGSCWTCTVITTDAEDVARPHPRPDAADGRAATAGPPGSTRRVTARDDLLACWCPRRRAGSRPTRSRRGQQRAQQRPRAGRAAARCEDARTEGRR